jgi:hypothetical protein
MPTLTDIFASDAFTDYALTAAIKKVPLQPNRLQRLGIFRPIAIDKTLVAIEEEQGKLGLIPSTKRGGPGIPAQRGKRVVTGVAVPHIQLDDAINADDLSNVRMFGQPSPASVEAAGGDVALAVARGVAAEKTATLLADMSRSIMATDEYLKLGAMLGTITYPTNSVDAALDLFTLFGTSAQQTQNWALTTPTTAIVDSIMPAVQDKINAAMGGTAYAGIGHLCGTTFFRGITGHATMKAAYLQQQAMYSAMGQVNVMDRTFRFGDHLFIEYPATIVGTAALTATACISFPMGADIFHEYLAPADTVAAAGTLGQPLYGRAYESPDGKAIQIESQRNPLNICIRPWALVLGANA